MKRLQKKLVGWQYRFWDDADNLRLIERLFPRLSHRYAAIPFGVAQSDIARCAYMYAYGGFYFDTDFKVLRAPDAAILAKKCVIPIEKHPKSENQQNFSGLGNASLGSEPEYNFGVI